MPRVTKADLEKQVQELEAKNRHYLNMLDEENNKYVKIVEEKEEGFKLTPLYQQLMKQIDQLEKQTRADKYYNDTMKEKNDKLKDRVRELLTENEKLKAVVHNTRKTGRKPISEEKVLQVENLIKQGKKEEEICKTVGIARATYYRVKKALKERKNDIHE